MQKADSNCSAGTNADSEQNDQDLSVSQHIRKPPVVGSQSSPMSLDNAIKEGYAIKNRSDGCPFPNIFSDCEWEEVS